uniref:Ig-like domain-containing protein n=1 Tax=Catharus ustulatus TaxID=91951 RepID=A0A8C3UJ86_CATUS
WGGGTGGLRGPLRSPRALRPSASLVSPRGMPCSFPAVPSPVVALAGWCPLSPAGAQTPQLLVEPPWTPAVLWDRVTLTCQGSGTAGDTTWYRNKRRVGQERRDSLTVTESGNYTCRRPGSGLRSSLMVSMVSGVWVSPAWHPRRPRGLRVGSKLGTLQDGTELSLSPLQLNHSGRYHCRGWLVFWERWETSGVTPVCPPLFPAVLAGVFGSLLFLVLLAVAFYCGHRTGG